MADLATVAGRVAPIDDDLCHIRTYIAGEAITAPAAVYLDPATGRVFNTVCSNAAKQQFRGIALETVGPGQAVDVQYEGPLSGFDVSGSSYDAPLYLSDNAGKVADTASVTKPIIVGRVLPLTDYVGSKIVHVRAALNLQY